MLGGDLHQIGAVTHPAPYCAHIALRPEGSSQQTYRMQKLQPLTFLPIRPPSRHILPIPGVDQTRSNPVPPQHIVEWNPIDSSGFHRNSIATVVMPQLTSHRAISSRSAVKVGKTRTGFSSRSA